MDNYKKYIVLWLSQCVSQLGSSMTSFALILWAYEQSRSALSVSLMSFCDYVPYILVSMFVGAFVDSHSKKAIMLVSDSMAALGTLSVMLLLVTGQLSIWNIYLINVVMGVTTAFQQPASAVAVGKLVPKDKLGRVSGMNSFSSNLIMVVKPMLAAALYGLGGLSLLLLLDLLSFALAFCVLLFYIHIPDQPEKKTRKSPFAGTVEGFRFLKKERGLLYIMLTMALINFFSRLTYENILSPMILARSGNNSIALGIVNAGMGIGGVLVSFKKESRHKIPMIYISAALSFLLGDVTMALGRNAFWWSFAGIAASLPIPFIVAAQNVILYRKVPETMQGRVFAVRNAIQYSTIPIGILLGGVLADYVFEPFMSSGRNLSKLLGGLVGTGAGSGMAVMFLCTGVCGFLVSIVSYRNKEIRKLEN